MSAESKKTYALLEGLIEAGRNLVAHPVQWGPYTLVDEAKGAKWASDLALFVSQAKDTVAPWADRLRFDGRLHAKAHVALAALETIKAAIDDGTVILSHESARSKGQAMKIFLSHSSKDARLAEALVEVLRAALPISPSDIRCTSVAGYRLRIGTKKDERLRREVVEAELLIGLITAASIESAYVLFELGARWGTDKHLLPLLGGKADSSYLQGPLSGYIALKCDQRDEVQQFVGDVAELLGLNTNRPEVYEKKLDAIVEFSKQLAATPEPQKLFPEQPPQLSEEEIAILKLLTQKDGEMMEDETIVSSLKINITECRYYLHKLDKAGYIFSHKNPYKASIYPGYRIQPKGREHLIVNNLLHSVAKIGIKPRNIRS